MARIAKRLAGPMLVDLTDELIYTVPAVTKTIVRHIHYVNATAAAVTLTISVGADTAANRIFDAYSVAAGAVIDFYPLLVLEAAETLRAHASADDTTTLTINGEEIVLG